MMERYDSGFRLAYELRKRERLAGRAHRHAERRGPGDRASASIRRARACCPGRKLDRFVDKPATGKQLLAVAEELLS